MKIRRIYIPRNDGRKMKLLIFSPKTPAATPRTCEGTPAAGATPAPTGTQSQSPATGVLWIHGGGYITGFAAMAGLLGMGRRLVRRHGCTVISPAYRLRRGGRYPNALADCYAALLYVASHCNELGIRPDQIFVGGESAGGGLCAALCQLARDRAEVNIAFQMPLYPMIDDRDTDSSRDNHSLGWNTVSNHFGWKVYLGELYGTDDVPPYAAAARRTDLAGLPPAYTFVCTGEPFYCETLTYVQGLREAGVEAELDIYEGLFHAFDILQPWRKVSRTAVERFDAAFSRARARYFAENK